VWGRTLLVDPPSGPSVSYSYNPADLLTEVTYGTATTGLQYDYAGRKLTMDDPDMGDWSYAYDALGNLLTQTDGRGYVTALSYDLLNRLSGKSYSGSCGATTNAVSYTYDTGTNGIGRRTRLDYGTGYYTTWSYDQRGRVIDTTFTAGQQETLPIWILGQMLKPRDRPITNVAAMLVVVLTVLPILFVQRLTEDNSDDGK
jgi:YD repeat-containing protein